VTTWIGKLASLRITPLAMLALAIGVFTSYRSEDPHLLWIAAPLAALAMNLLCAILVTQRFRRDTGLLMFHICLLAVVTLAAYGYLAQFRGRVEIAVGQQFQPEQVTAVTRGPLHNDDALLGAQFVQEALRVNFAAGLFREQTRSRVRLASGEQWEFGDNVPLRLGGYRFYTSSNKGYSALLRWTDANGKRTLGVVNFPSFPFYDWNQIKAWMTPGNTPLNLQLELGEKPPRDKAWSLDSRVTPAAQLAVDVEGRRTQLHRGDTLRIRGGSLTFLGTRMWMGYTVYFFPLLNLLFACALVGVAGLGWYYLNRYGVLTARLAVGRPQRNARGAAQ